MNEDTLKELERLLKGAKKIKLTILSSYPKGDS